MNTQTVLHPENFIDAPLDDQPMMPKNTVNTWPDLVSADDFCANPPDTPPELIKGVLYRNGTMMLSGASKAHKTFTMLAAGIAIATGREWLGFQTTKVPVIYMNLELQDFSSAKRINSIARAMDIAPPKDLHLLNLRGHIATIDALESHIPRLIAETGAGLVVVDPHYKISSVSGIEENSNDGQASFLSRIESAICTHGAAVMIAHHFAKGDASAKNSIDRAAGGGSLARFPDAIMTLTEHTEKDCSTAEFHLRDFAPVDPFVVRWKHPVWHRDNDLDPANLKRSAGRKETHTEEAALKALGEGGLTNSEWIKKTNMPDATFRRKRDGLVNAGKVHQRSCLYYPANT